METIASSRAFIQYVSDIVENEPGSTLNGFVSDPGQINMETITLALEAGNEDVRKMVYEAGQALGIVAANLIGVLGSCRILLRGSVAHFGQMLLDPMREEMDKRTLPSLARVSEVGVAKVGSDIVIQGASALILQNELGVL